MVAIYVIFIEMKINFSGMIKDYITGVLVSALYKNKKS